MTPECLAQELEAFRSEYGTFLVAIDTVDKTSPGTIHFTTREQETFACSISDSGWEVDNRFFSTSQEMLSALSPTFTSEWGRKLLQSLQELAKCQSQEIEKHE